MNSVSRFSYDAPLLVSLDGVNGPTYPAVTLTVFGSNFGTVDSSSTASVGYTTVGRTHISDSATSLAVPFGAGQHLPVRVSTGDEISGGTLLFSYDLPHVTGFTPISIPVEVPSIISVFGKGFGAV